MRERERERERERDEGVLVLNLYDFQTKIMQPKI
jgi:hypothetical protein